MEKNNELIVRPKDKKFKLKNILRKINLKKLLFILIFFLVCYVISELLNGSSIDFVRIFDFSIRWTDKADYVDLIIKGFFKCPKFIVNYCLFVCLYFILYGLTNRTKFSCLTILTFDFLFGLINYTVRSFRGISVTLSDIYSVRTALNVASGLKLSVNGNFVVSVGLFAVFVFIIVKLIYVKDKYEKRPTIAKNVTIVLGVIGLVAICAPDYFTKDVQLWNINNAYADSGAGLTLIRMAKDFKVSKPKKYNVDDSKNILAQYEDDVDSVEDISDLPNVLVIMNESFSDLALSYNLDLSDDPIAFYHELITRDNVVSGVMHSSQFGGGTANVEYEFITQNATAFLPPGAMPYQQYISSNIKQSIVAYMNRLGYKTYGIHSWEKSGYSREKIYKFLGFDYAWFKENLGNLQFCRSGYSSDQSTYEVYYDIMNNKPDDEKIFSFIVTMQNHLPYNDVDPNGIQFLDGDNDIISYLQSEYLADMALKNLIDYLSEYKEDVIVLFFGDHQPNLNQKDLYSLTGNYAEDSASQVVPFFIWANFDINKKDNIETSANYLESLLLETAGMPKDSYTKYVESIREEIPVITNHYYMNNDGDSYEVSDSSSPYFDKLQEYWRVIYYNMFDNK